jgi:cytochrome c-type biogenesis protein CcmH/NrfG
LQLKDAIARMEYNHLKSSHQRYLKLQLNNRLDDKIVAAKKKQLETLEKNYQGVLKYQSPPWALRACYRMAEINREFARFLKESPVPALSAEQKAQYIRLLGQKAQQYAYKADQYYQTGLQLAGKWEICDPVLSGYFSAHRAATDPENGVKSFAGVNRSVEIAAQSLKDAALIDLYNQLIRQPDDLQPFLSLADSYLQKGDYRQSALVAQNALGKINRRQSNVVSQIHNTLGVSWLYLGEDEQARDAFKQAIEHDDANAAARINLAGLYIYYGHTGKAEQIYGKVSTTQTKGSVNGRIHPRAGDMFYGNRKISKK